MNSIRGHGHQLAKHIAVNVYHFIHCYYCDDFIAFDGLNSPIHMNHEWQPKLLRDPNAPTVQQNIIFRLIILIVY